MTDVGLCPGPQGQTPASSGEVSLREVGGISGGGLQKTPGGAVALEVGEADED